jgi:hypothetical protein
MPADQRLAGIAALGLFATMLLPWYRASFPRRDEPFAAISAFSWVEAAVLLTALAVLALIFARAERRAFHLPGGDGLVITAAGAWTFFLIVWRLFDRPELGTGVAVGLKWGIYVAAIAAIVLAYAGTRVRAAHRAEPPLPPVRERRRGGADEVVLADERPHLAETEVLDGARVGDDGEANS